MPTPSLATQVSRAANTARCVAFPRRHARGFSSTKELRGHAASLFRSPKNVFTNASELFARVRRSGA